MSQAHSDPKRESDSHALPDIEVFHLTAAEAKEQELAGKGWYWWPCFPGCLPDGDPIGPFASEAEALADAQDGVED